MNRFLLPALIGIASSGAFAQDAASIAAQREAEERDRRTSSRIEGLEQSNAVQQRRINELINEVTNLRRQITDLEIRFKNSERGAVTGTDIKKIYDKMAEIERNRQADNNLIKDQFVELRKILDKPPVIIERPTPVQPPTNTREKQPKDNPPEDAPQEFTGEYYPYKVKSGDNLTKIISAYNAQLKDQGKAPITLDMVKKANPKINSNNLMVGREIKIPIPPNK
jgi:hypothetical protein